MHVDAIKFGKTWADFENRNGLSVFAVEARLELAPGVQVVATSGPVLLKSVPEAAMEQARKLLDTCRAAGITVEGELTSEHYFS
jgi:hypothetical protein